MREFIDTVCMVILLFTMAIIFLGCVFYVIETNPLFILVLPIAALTWLGFRHFTKGFN